MGELTKLQDSVYRGIKDHISISELNLLDKAPIVFKKYIIDGVERKKSKALRIGTLWHTVLLEPEKIGDFIVSRSDDERTLFFKEAEKEAKEKNTIAVSKKELDQALTARDEIMSHPKIKTLLQGALVERAMFWESDGVKCKGKFDAYNHGALIDFKTTESIRGFQDSILSYNYHRQMAFYLDGLNACDVSCNRVYWIVCEKESPYLHKVFECDKESIFFGRQEYRELLKKYKECKLTNVWPGLNHDVEVTGLPKWYLDKQVVNTDLRRQV